MSTPTHYSVPGLVYHHLSLNQPHPHSIPDSSHPHPSFTPDMSWRQSHHSPSQSISSQMQPLIQQPQDHVPDYAAQQSFIARHTTDVYSNHPPSSSVDPGPSSHSISFDSPQIDSSIGPDRVLRTRRVRLPERVQSHGEQLSEYPAISQSYTQPQNPSSYVPHTQQGSRPHTPAPQTIYTLTGDVPDDVSLSNPDPFLEGLAKRRGGDGYEWRVFYPPGSRSASGSAASASSNPRSASPALSVASALTSVSSSASMPPCPPCQEGFPSTTALLRKEPTRKKRLWNIDRYNICKYAELHPGTKQEDIAARYGVERSTVSKILKQKARWLHVSPEETVLVAKLRPSKFPSLERRLEEWVKLASKAGKTLTDSVLRQKAREFGDEMGYTPEKFKASSGWLENFKHRHGIRRGVWHGNGYEDAKYRACGTDFIPPPDPNGLPPSAAYTIRQHSPTPMPMSMSMEEPSHGDGEEHGHGHGHGHGDHDMGLESEEEDGGEQDGLSMSASAMHPPPISLQQAWSQVHDEAPTQGEPSNAPETYYSPEQPQHLDYPPQSQHDTEQTELAPPMLQAEPVAIRDEESGEQVYVMPVMPELIPEQTTPTLAEAEMALDKVILYIEQNGNEAVLDDDDYKFLMGIKYKVFGKMARRTFSGGARAKS